MLQTTGFYLGAACVLIGVSTPCMARGPGADVFVNPVNPTEYGWNSNINGGSQQAADDFVLDSGAVISSVTFYGFDSTGLLSNNFTVRIFRFNAGLGEPEAAPFYEAALGLLDGTDTGLMNPSGISILEYSADIPDVALPAGEEFWLMVGSNDPTTWAWSHSDPVGAPDTQYHRSGDADVWRNLRTLGFPDSRLDQAFTLTAVEECPCPEDIDRDGRVAFSDILRILGAWGPCSEDACDTPGVCGDYTQCGTGDPMDCFCWTTFDGEGVCYQNFLCDLVIDCFDGNCPPGFVCVVESCCVDPKCVPMVTCDEAARLPEGASGLTGSGRVIESNEGVAGFDFSPGAVADRGPVGLRPSEMAGRAWVEAPRAAAVDETPPVARSTQSVFFDRPSFDAANPDLPVLDFEGIAPVGDIIEPAPQPWAPSVLFTDPAGSTESVAIADSGFVFATPTDVLFMDLFDVPLVATFDPDVNAVGFNLAIGFGGLNVQVEVFGPGGGLLESVAFGTDPETVFRTFVGFSDIGTIGSVVITPEPGGFVLIDGFAYGTADDPCDRPCPEDIDRDGRVAFSDILRVLGAWGPCEECDDCEDGNVETCNDDDTCLDCITPNGECNCAGDRFAGCETLQRCPDGTCPPGFYCCTNTCCDEPVCLPFCGTPIPEDRRPTQIGELTPSGPYAGQ